MFSIHDFDEWLSSTHDGLLKKSWCLILVHVWDLHMFNADLWYSGTIVNSAVTPANMPLLWRFHRINGANVFQTYDLCLQVKLLLYSPFWVLFWLIIRQSNQTLWSKNLCASIYVYSVEPRSVNNLSNNVCEFIVDLYGYNHLDSTAVLESDRFMHLLDTLLIIVSC